MEAVIARLLNDFESGRLTRRQLVQTLALVAVGSPVASALGQGATPATSRGGPPPAPWKTVWLDHISYAVSDYKKSVDFYTNLMGWEVRGDNGTQAMLDINGIGNIIIRSSRRGGAAAPITGVINHIAFGVEPWDTDAVRAELELRDLNPSVDNQGETYKSFHVRDPDGWDLQISNQTKSRPVPALPSRGGGEER